MSLHIIFTIKTTFDLSELSSEILQNVHPHLFIYHLSSHGLEICPLSTAMLFIFLCTSVAIIAHFLYHYLKKPHYKFSLYDRFLSWDEDEQPTPTTPR